MSVYTSSTFMPTMPLRSAFSTSLATSTSVIRSLSRIVAFRANPESLFRTRGFSFADTIYRVRRRGQDLAAQQAHQPDARFVEDVERDGQGRHREPVDRGGQNGGCDRHPHERVAAVLREL